MRSIPPLAATLALAAALALPSDTQAQSPSLAGAAQGFGSSTSGLIDVDRDGLPDLVSVTSEVGGFFPPPLLILWGRGRGDGSFRYPQTLIENVPYPLPAGVYLPLPLALDADDDGLQDLVLAPRQLYRARASGGFDDAIALPPEVASTLQRKQIAVADLTGDGRLDLLVRGQSAVVDGALQHPVLLLENGGDLSFGASTVNTDALGSSLYALTAAPVDGDALADAILVTGSLGNLTLRVYPSLGGGAFGVPTTLPLTKIQSVSALRSADLDGDGDLDLLCGEYVAGEPGVFVTLEGAGDGTFTEGPLVSNVTASELGMCFQDIVDLDGDGTLDAVLVSGNEPFVGVLPGLPGGGFDALRSFPVPDGIYNTDFVCAEVDGDPPPEFLVTSFFYVVVVQGGGPFIDLGSGTLPPAGVVLKASGSTQPGKKFELALRVPNQGTLAALFVSPDLLTFQPVGGGPFGVAPNTPHFVLAPATLSGRWPAGLPDGATFYAQAWVSDGAAGFTTSNVIALVAETP